MCLWSREAVPFCELGFVGCNDTNRCACRSRVPGLGVCFWIRGAAPFCKPRRTGSSDTNLGSILGGARSYGPRGITMRIVTLGLRLRAIKQEQRGYGSATSRGARAAESLDRCYHPRGIMIQLAGCRAQGFGVKYVLAESRGGSALLVMIQEQKRYEARTQFRGARSLIRAEP